MTSKSNSDYFKSYDINIHKCMLDDKVRTEAYRDAILKNSQLFTGKVVLDVGAGTGILSLFAAQAGAVRVYAVEASEMATPLLQIIKVNKMSHRIEVIQGMAEDIELPEKVDIIISEWMGFYLFHESMLNSLIRARDKHLEENDGLMFPSHATLYVSPISLNSLSMERKNYWSNVYGFDMSPLYSQREPMIQNISDKFVLSPGVPIIELDLRWTNENEIISLRSRKFVSIQKAGSFSGFALWFDVTFSPPILDEFDRIHLSTSPFSTPTHWKQTLLDIHGSYEVEVDEVIGWEIHLKQSKENYRHYDIEVEVLNPSCEDHPIPCGCQMAKCSLFSALLTQEEETLNQI